MERALSCENTFVHCSVGNSGWMLLHYTDCLLRSQSEQAVASVADKTSLDFPGKSGSGLPFPTPGDFPDPGIEPTSLASSALASGFFTT